MISSLNHTWPYFPELVIQSVAKDEVHVMIQTVGISDSAQMKGIDMTNSEELCGTCSHFGKDLGSDLLVQIRINPREEVIQIASCDLPDNALRHLRVSAISQCDSYCPAA